MLMQRTVRSLRAASRCHLKMSASAAESASVTPAKSMVETPCSGHASRAASMIWPAVISVTGPSSAKPSPVRTIVRPPCPLAAFTGRSGLVLALQRLDQAVDTAIADRIVEFFAIVGDEADTADRDVVGAPAFRRLLEVVVDGHRLPARLGDRRAHDDIGVGRLHPQRLEIHHVVL